MRLALVAVLMLGTGCASGGARGAKTPIDSVSVDGRALVVRFSRGNEACHHSQSVSVDERPGEVRLTAWVRGTGGSCTSEAHPTSERVTLDGPLGQRVVVDTTTGSRLVPTSVR
jgi:hypothetical protein